MAPQILQKADREPGRMKSFGSQSNCAWYAWGEGFGRLGGKASEGQTPRKSTVSELGAKLATRDPILKKYSDFVFDPMMGLIN